MALNPQSRAVGPRKGEHVVWLDILEPLANLNPRCAARRKYEEVGAPDAIRTCGLHLRRKYDGIRQPRRGLSGVVYHVESREKFSKPLLQAHVLGKGDRPKKAITVVTDRGRIQRHIVPLLGGRRVKDLTKADIDATPARRGAGGLPAGAGRNSRNPEGCG